MTSKGFSFNWPAVLSRIVLLLALIQVGMFFVGLEVPLTRLRMLWGKSFQERQAIVWPVGRTFARVAEQLPLDAKIYVEDPQLQWDWVHWHAMYYLYPRYVSASMTDQYYGLPDKLAAWHEYPDEGWLVSNHFTHVMSFKNGIHIRLVSSQSQLQPNLAPTPRIFPNATP